LTDPPNEQILGWWKSGQRDDDAILCAAVRAEDEVGARCAVLKDWPEATEWRFCDQLKKFVNSERFPLKRDWVRQRLASAQMIDADEQAVRP
jgi:ribosomal protein S19E (S16A)